MRKRRLLVGGLTVGVVAATVLFIEYQRYNSIPGRFDRIQEGMSVEEVQAVLQQRPNVVIEGVGPDYPYDSMEPKSGTLYI